MTERKPPSLLRTFLFAPGDHARRVEKSLTLGADAVILDLEDAVAAAEKPKARGAVVAALARPRSCKGYVRVNSLQTPWCHGDLMAVVAAGVDGIVLPKVEQESDLRTIDWLLGELERERGLPPGGIDLMPIVETALGFSNLRQIARAGTRMRRIAFGAGDFTLDTGIAWSAEEHELLPHRSALIVESRAAGLEAPVDTVWIRLDDPEGFARSAQRSKDLGFQGRLCIHPDQVRPVNEIFTPSDAEVAQARRVVAAFAEAEARGLAAIQVDGKFVDYPLVYLAEGVLARAAQIAATRRPS